MSLDERLKSVARAYLSMHEKKDMTGMVCEDCGCEYGKVKEMCECTNEGSDPNAKHWVSKETYNEGKEVQFVIPEDIPANERTAFHGAAAAAHKGGKSHFNFNGKKHPVTMKKDTAKAINSSTEEGVEIEVDKDSEASPEMKKKEDPKKKKGMKVTKSDDKSDDKETSTDVAEGVDTSPAGNSPAAKAMAARDAEVLDQAQDKKREKRRDEDKQDGTNAVKEAPKRHNDSKVGEKPMKRFKDMR